MDPSSIAGVEKRVRSMRIGIETKEAKTCRQLMLVIVTHPKVIVIVIGKEGIETETETETVAGIGNVTVFHRLVHLIRDHHLLQDLQEVVFWHTRTIVIETAIEIVTGREIVGMQYQETIGIPVTAVETATAVVVMRRLRVIIVNEMIEAIEETSVELIIMAHQDPEAMEPVVITVLLDLLTMAMVIQTYRLHLHICLLHIVLTHTPHL